MYLYGCSHHNPDPLKEKIGSKGRRWIHEPSFARTLDRQHTANLKSLKPTDSKLEFTDKPSNRWLEVMSVEKYILGLLRLKIMNSPRE